MGKYFDNYDIFGEPKSLLGPGCELPSDALIRNLEKAEQEASACIGADDLYDTLRHQGISHTEARKAVAEKFGV